MTTSDSDKSQEHVPYDGVVSQVVAKIKNEPFLFVIAIVVLLIGLAVLATGLGSPDLRFIVVVIAFLAFVVIIGYYLQTGLQIRVKTQHDEKKAASLIDEKFGDHRVEEIKKRLNQLHEQPHPYKLPLRAAVFPVLKNLFIDRNTFNEHIEDCRDENWADRFIAAIETRRLLEIYWPHVNKHASVGDNDLVGTKDELDLHQYLQKMTGLFEPIPRVNEVEDELRRGNFERIKDCLRDAEIHPKQEILQKVKTACDNHQDRMKEVWGAWPNT